MNSLKWLLNEVRGNALWDGIKFLIGVIVVMGYWFIQHAKGLPANAWTSLGLLLGTLILTVILTVVARRRKSITAEIKEVHLIPSELGADCFVRLAIYSKSDPIYIMECQMMLIIDTGEHVGRRADASGYFLIDRSGGKFDEDGDQHWIEISREILGNLPVNAPVLRTNPLTGWLRFRFEGLPKWDISGEFIGVGTETDEFGYEQQCPEYDDFFVETTATAVTVVLIDFNGKQTKARSENVSCDQSRTIKRLRE